MINDPTALLVILAGIVFLALRLQAVHQIFRSLGTALVGLLIGMTLSNTGVLPATSPTYAFLASTGVSPAIVLILLGVDIKSVRQAGPIMFGAFVLGAIGTAVGALVSALVVADAVGSETWKLAGQFTGTYTGGGVNFAALGRAFETSPNMFSAAVAADVALTAIWLAVCLVAPLLFGSAAQAVADPPDDQHRREDDVDTRLESIEEPGSATLARSLDSSVLPVPIADAAALVFLAAGSLWLAGQIAQRVTFLPEVLWLTTIALSLGQVPAIKRLTGAAMVGNYLLLLFLAGNGAQSVLANIFSIGPGVFFFALGTIAVHGVVIFGAGRLFGFDAATVAVASQANIGGPSSAIAICSARGYTDKVLPSIAIGLMGYAVGNYSGFAVANLVRWLVGGG